MTRRRALSETLVDIADGVLALAAPPGLRARSLEVTLPVEVEMAADGEDRFRAELLRFVTRTAFDKPPSRMTVRWAEAVEP